MDYLHTRRQDGLRFELGRGIRVRHRYHHAEASRDRAGGESAEADQHTCSSLAGPAKTRVSRHPLRLLHENPSRRPTLGLAGLDRETNTQLPPIPQSLRLAISSVRRLLICGLPMTRERSVCLQENGGSFAGLSAGSAVSGSINSSLLRLTVFVSSG